MLDPLGRKEVIETVEQLNREKGITVLSITHYMNEAARADRVIVIDDGRVLMDGTPREVFANTEALLAAGLDVPQCTALVHTLRREGVALEGEPITTEECAELICRALADCGALDGLVHSHHLLSQADNILYGLDAWRLSTGSEALVLPAGVGKETVDGSPDRELFRKVIKEFLSASMESHE